MSSEIWRPRFPLYKIGVIRGITQRQSSDESPIEAFAPPLEPAEPALVVYGEHRGATSPISVPLHQPSSLSEHSGAENSMESLEQHTGRSVDDFLVQHLVERAHWWLINYKTDNGAMPLSPSIYWAIRSLRFFYTGSLMRAATGARRNQIRDDEWPDPPEGNDNYDWSSVPNWLYHLLNMERLHDWGLRGI